MPRLKRRQNQQSGRANGLLHLRSALFLIWFIVVSLVAHIATLPFLFFRRKFTARAARCWAKLCLWGLRVFAGLSYEVRGGRNFIHGPVLIASKHQSMWETMAFMALLDDPAVVIKRELLSIPFYGWFARKAEMIAIDRKAGGGAIRTMLAEARKALSEGRPLLIFPEGTRKAVGASPDYKPGIAGLYTELEVPCVPVALNSGLYWVAGGLIKKPGTIVVEFLETIPPGLPRQEFMRTLETRTETATSRLVEEGKNALAAKA